jgi:hypothetical protein
MARNHWQSECHPSIDSDVTRAGGPGAGLLPRRRPPPPGRRRRRPTKRVASAALNQPRRPGAALQPRRQPGRRAGYSYSGRGGGHGHGPTVAAGACGSRRGLIQVSVRSGRPRRGVRARRDRVQVAGCQPQAVRFTLRFKACLPGAGGGRGRGPPRAARAGGGRGRWQPRAASATEDSDSRDPPSGPPPRAPASVPVCPLCQPECCSQMDC